MNNVKRNLSIKLNLTCPEIKHFVIKLTSNRKNAPLKCKINRSIMLKWSHRARTKSPKRSLRKRLLYYKAQMLHEDRFYTPFLSHDRYANWTEQDRNKSNTNFLFFFEIRIVLHLREWLTCGRQRRPPTCGIKRSQDGPHIIIIL